jgi:hypothetical protein
MKYVKSIYKAGWKGVVIEEIKRGKYFDSRKTWKMNPLYKVVMILTASNNKPIRRYVVIRDSAWFKEIQPFDISWVNKDWFI